MQQFEEYAKLLVEVGVNIQEGQNLVIACPVECAWFARLCARAAYAAGCREVVMNWKDDALSRELTQLTLEANLRIRDLGFKPYVAPAISSGALQLLLALRGEWHCSSAPLGGIWFGCLNRFGCYGLEIETLELPETLFARLRETERALREIS